MKVVLELNKTVDENATAYFEKAKKSRKKISGAKKTLEEFTKKTTRESEKILESESKLTKLTHSKAQWFEKFKWFISSDNYLIIAGRDATTNEVVIKKHTLPKDIVFHTDMAGSPFSIIKFESSDISLIQEDLKVPKFNTIPETTLLETATFTLVHAKAWKLGLGGASVFWITPEQVSKEANSGEFMGKGSFMIRGKTNHIIPEMNYAIGLIGNFVMGAPLTAVQKHCKTIIEIVQGNEKSSVVAKKIKATFREKEGIDVAVDDIIKVLPAGGCDIKKERIRKY